MKAKLKFGLNLVAQLLNETTSVARSVNIAEELHRAARRQLPRRKAIAKKIDQIWDDDLMDFSKDYIYQNRKKYMYVLVNIYVFSKNCWCYLIKNIAMKNLIEC